MKLPKFKFDIKMLAILTTVIAIGLWLLMILLTLVAIFIDSSPAEGNIGGAAFLTFVVACVMSCIAGFAWDEV